MRETHFIKQNQDKWQTFEQILDGQYHDPDKLSDLFVQVTDDLSYSRTFYPNRSVRVYLNGLAQRVFFRIYRTRRSPLGRMMLFWTDELPRLVYAARRDFRLSFWVFACAFLIGAVSGAMDPEFSSAILGEDYVDMTLANIESGDPMAVYKQRGEFGMSLGITANNLFVAFLTFVMGAFYAVGAIAILIRNGIMVGVFQYFFIERGLFWESFLTIWTHGTLEISAIVIAGAAGITMGKGLVFPGTYTRMQSFQQSARRGIKIMIGIAPIIIMAGFIEGYLTRYTQTPDGVRALFILICLTFVLWYFVAYPRQRALSAGVAPDEREDVPPNSALRIAFDRIKSAGEIFADVFVFFKKHAGKVAVMAGAAAAVYTTMVFAMTGVRPSELFSFPTRTFGTLSVVDQFFVNEHLPGLPLLNLVIFAGLTVGLGFLLLQEHDPSRRRSWRQYVAAGMNVSAGLALMQILLWTNDWYTVLFIILFFPVPLLLNYVVLEEKVNLWTAIRRTSFLLEGNYGRLLSVFLTLFLVGLLFFSLIDTAVLWAFIDLVSWVVQLEPGVMNEFSIILLTGLTLFFFYMMVALLLTGIGLFYYSLCEIQEAGHLLDRVRQLRAKEQIRGMEKESTRI